MLIWSFGHDHHVVWDRMGLGAVLEALDRMDNDVLGCVVCLLQEVSTIPTRFRGDTGLGCGSVDLLKQAKDSRLEGSTGGTIGQDSDC